MTARISWNARGPGSRRASNKSHDGLDRLENSASTGKVERIHKELKSHGAKRRLYFIHTRALST